MPQEQFKYDSQLRHGVKITGEQIFETFEEVSHMIISERCVPGKRASQCKSSTIKVCLPYPRNDKASVIGKE